MWLVAVGTVTTVRSPRLTIVYEKNALKRSMITFLLSYLYDIECGTTGSGCIKSMRILFTSIIIPTKMSDVSVC